MGQFLIHPSGNKNYTRVSVGSITRYHKIEIHGKHGIRFILRDTVTEPTTSMTESGGNTVKLRRAVPSSSFVNVTWGFDTEDECMGYLKRLDEKFGIKI
jgi:hypothetical protein